MSEIAEFIAAQLDREHRDAQLISSGGYRPQRWEVSEYSSEWPFNTYMSEITALDWVLGADTETEPPERNRMALVTDGRNEDQHIARYDPERICIEIEAKRRLLAFAADLEALDRWPDAEVIHHALAAPYADRPGFKPEWRIDA